MQYARVPPHLPLLAPPSLARTHIRNPRTLEMSAPDTSTRARVRLYVCTLAIRERRARDIAVYYTEKRLYGPPGAGASGNPIKWQSGLQQKKTMISIAGPSNFNMGRHARITTYPAQVFVRVYMKGRVESFARPRDERIGCEWRARTRGRAPTDLIYRIPTLSKSVCEASKYPPTVYRSSHSRG